MNHNNTHQTLKTNESLLTDIDTKLASQSTELTSIGNDIAGIGTSQANEITQLTNINAKVGDIKTELTKKKIIFNALLTDGSNNHLTRSDYSSSPIHFSWQNDKGTPVYIYKYRFTYPPVGGTEPGPGQLYHNTSWTCNIGAMNSAGDDYEAPYIQVTNNKFYFHNTDQNHIKQNWVTNPHFNYQHDFSEAPIEIGISRKFGHYINADINTSTYDAPPLGIIDGYYYSS